VSEVQVLPLVDDELDCRSAALELIFDALRAHVPDHIVAVLPPHLLEHGKPRRAELLRRLQVPRIGQEGRLPGGLSTLAK
jgi:hypothetical protein